MPITPGETRLARKKCSSRNRCHHLLKTFWGWRDQQLPDGTVIWRLPDGHTYVTTPGSALLFPGLCVRIGELSDVDPAGVDRCGDRMAMMPPHISTRSQNRASRIAAERQHNRQARQAAHRQPQRAYSGPAPPGVSDDQPPPF